MTEMYGIKPVQHKIPPCEMSNEMLLHELERWLNNEALAHATFENWSGAGCETASFACWKKCKRLVKELQDEIARRNE